MEVFYSCLTVVSAYSIVSSKAQVYLAWCCHEPCQIMLIASHIWASGSLSGLRIRFPWHLLRSTDSGPHPQRFSRVWDQHPDFKSHLPPPPPQPHHMILKCPEGWEPETQIYYSSSSLFATKHYPCKVFVSIEEFAESWEPGVAKGSTLSQLKFNAEFS